MVSLFSMLAPIGRLWHRLRSDQRGNVLMLMGFSIIPLTLATGIAIDYARASRLQTRFNAAADAAALAAVTQPMMQKDDATAKDVATKMFNAQAQGTGLAGLIYDPANLTVTITPVYGVTPGRIATVTYTAQSINAFGGIIGKSTVTIGGTATANATKAPYIDFYLLLDTSPSMLLPSTSSGLSQMRTYTSNGSLPNGCAFACHTMNPHDDNIYIRDSAGKDIWLDSAGNSHSVQSTYTNSGTKYVVYYNASGNLTASKESDGNYADAYWLAYNKGITMRIDAEQEAVRELVPTAKSIADENKVSYRMAVNRFDYGPNFGTVASLTPLDTNANMQSIIDKSTGLPMTYWYRNSQITSSSNIDDQSTDYQTALTKMNNLMPVPGTGITKLDPQEILFIITDGVSDENVSGSRTHRELQPTHIAQCTAIKNRNIQIAILYTEYLPDSLTGDSWSQANVAPYLPNVEPQLKACASPGLYQKVTTDDSISAALTALFKQAIASAHLTQ